MDAFRFGLCFVAALMVATCGAHPMQEIRERFRSRFAPGSNTGHYPRGPFHGGSATASVQPGYYQAPVDPHKYDRQPAYRHSSPVPAAYPSRDHPSPRYAPAYLVRAPVSRVAPRYPDHFVAGSTSSSAALGGGAASSAASASGGNRAGSSAASSAAASAGGRYGGAAASSATASGGASGAARSSHAPAGHNSHVVESEEHNEHYNEPETVNTFGAQSGTFANDGKGFETSSYVRNTENVEKHEDGKEDDDHYYNAQSYGKTYDENKREVYNNDDEDVIHTPTVFRRKKSNTNYVSDFNKARRESGSGVLAHDKHSASYNKNSKKLNEKVDQRYHKEGEGIVDTKDFSSESHIDDEDEERIDNHGLGNFVGVDGVHHAKRPAFNAHQAAAAAAAASSSAGGKAGAGATSATATVRR